MRFGHIVITAVIHVAAFEMALLEILLRCFRRRKQPSSEQDRPLVESRDASEEHPASNQFVDATEQLPLTPTNSERPATLALEPAPQPVAIEPQHTIVEHPDEKETATSRVTAPLTPQV